VGIYDIDDGHKRGYMNVQDGAEYRGTGFEDLGRGLYFIDEYKNIVQVNNSHEAHRVVASVISGRRSERERHATLHKMVDDWFRNNPEEITEKDVRAKPMKEIKDASQALKGVLENWDDLASPDAAVSRIVATMMANRSFIGIVDKTKNAWKESVTKDLEAQYQQFQDEHMVDTFEKYPQFREFLKTLKPDDLRTLANVTDKASMDRNMQTYVESYRKIYKEFNPKQKTRSAAKKEAPKEPEAPKPEIPTAMR